MDMVPTDFSTLTEEDTAIYCTGDHTWGKCDRDGCDFWAPTALPLEAAETAAAGPDAGGEGGTRTPPPPAVRDGENLADALMVMLVEYGVAGRGSFEGPNGMVRRMIARAYRMGAQAGRRPRVKVPRDTVDMGEAIKRLVLSMGRRAQDGDLEAITVLAMLATIAKATQATAAVDLHHQHGYTWAEIGQAVGISRQAAEQRWAG